LAFLKKLLDSYKQLKKQIKALSE